jgi:hypothetical protein
MSVLLLSASQVAGITGMATTLSLTYLIKDFSVYVYEELCQSAFFHSNNA